MILWCNGFSRLEVFFSLQVFPEAPEPEMVSPSHPLKELRFGRWMLSQATHRWVHVAPSGAVEVY